jgi:hypothetical protein
MSEMLKPRVVVSQAPEPEPKKEEMPPLEPGTPFLINRTPGKEMPTLGCIVPAYSSFRISPPGMGIEMFINNARPVMIDVEISIREV